METCSYPVCPIEGGNHTVKEGFKACENDWSTDLIVYSVCQSATDCTIDVSIESIETLPTWVRRSIQFGNHCRAEALRNGARWITHSCSWHITCWSGSSDFNTTSVAFSIFWASWEPFVGWKATTFTRVTSLRDSGSTDSDWRADSIQPRFAGQSSSDYCLRSRKRKTIRSSIPPVNTTKQSR